MHSKRIRMQTNTNIMGFWFLLCRILFLVPLLFGVSASSFGGSSSASTAFGASSWLLFGGCSCFDGSCSFGYPAFWWFLLWFFPFCGVVSFCAGFRFFLRLFRLLFATVSLFLVVLLLLAVPLLFLVVHVLFLCFLFLFASFVALVAVGSALGLVTVVAALRGCLVEGVVALLLVVHHFHQFHVVTSFALLLQLLSSTMRVIQM
eukprot:826250_1